MRHVYFSEYEYIRFYFEVVHNFSWEGGLPSEIIAPIYKIKNQQNINMQQIKGTQDCCL